MTKKGREKELRLPPVHETMRRQLVAALRDGPASAKDLSGTIGISEMEVYAHLQHIRISMHSGKAVFEMEPSQCVKCGFVFHKRDRLRKPGKCPVCRSESIRDARFFIREKS